MSSQSLGVWLQSSLGCFVIASVRCDITRDVSSTSHPGVEQAEGEKELVACRCQSGGRGYWQRFRESAQTVFTQDYPAQLMDKSSAVHLWIRDFPCPAVSDNRFRGLAALSDCAPGVILLHVACSQRLLLSMQFDEALDQLIEALQALPFAEPCLGRYQNAKERWPVSVRDVHSNYIRWYRAISYYHQTPALVPDLIWRFSRDCFVDGDCPVGEVCVDRRCAELSDEMAASSECAAMGTACPPQSRCTSLRAPAGTECVLALSPMCVVNGDLEAFHPRSACLPSTSYPRMIKACSEMGTTLYNLNWSSMPFDARVAQGTLAEAQALILPVTLRLRSPWHAIHSLVPAFAQVALDERYDLLTDSRPVDLLLVDQDLDKDRHIWDQVLGPPSEGIGPFAFLLDLISSKPYLMMADITTPRCYERAVWGHEHMLYSGGGWVDSSHVLPFTAAAKALVGGPSLPSIWGSSSGDVGSVARIGPRVLLVERRNETRAWGRWIDNFADVHEAAKGLAVRRPDLVGSVHVADFAELSTTDQLRLAASVRIVFGAHGDGLTWAMYTGEGGALLEAVPGRDRGFQVCVEGVNENPSGIFGGLARLARQTHICWLNPRSKVRPFVGDEKDVWQWNWRQMNLHINIEKFAGYLTIAAERVQQHEMSVQS